MLSASLYLIVCSARNRLRVRLRRLREPRYLIGGIVGSAYLYFAVFNRGGAAGGPRRAWPRAGGTGIGVAGHGIVAGRARGCSRWRRVVWLLPARSALLEFSRAEAAFLFPAPLTRRQLLLHKILRSQIGSLIASWSSSRSSRRRPRRDGCSSPWRSGSFFVSARVYFAGVALTRVRLKSR